MTAGSHYSSGPAPDQEQITIVARKLTEAMVANDVARVASFFTRDWAIVSDAGLSGPGVLVRAVANGELVVSAMANLSEPRVKIYGDTAIYTVRTVTTAALDGQRVDGDEWVTHVFVRQEGTWRCALTHLTTARTR